MSYSTLMVHLELGRSNAALLRVVGGLAERFGAGIIGIAACQPMQILYGEGTYVPGDLIEQDQAENERKIRATEAEFRRAFEKHDGFLDLRSTLTFGSLADYLANEARGADLFVTGVTSGALLDAEPHVSTGDLIMQIGRPVLIVPQAAETLELREVMVAWKDTRETRRAALDALPLLKKAAHVTIVEIAGEERLEAARAQVADVAGWLKRHGVAAECLVVLSGGDDALRLDGVAEERAADIVVAGAYGHNRLREWALGGVTRDLLMRSDRCSLLSH